MCPDRISRDFRKRRWQTSNGSTSFRLWITPNGTRVGPARYWESNAQRSIGNSNAITSAGLTEFSGDNRLSSDAACRADFRYRADDPHALLPGPGISQRTMPSCRMHVSDEQVSAMRTECCGRCVLGKPRVIRAPHHAAAGCRPNFDLQT